jgi:hypothetical protein
MKSIATLVGVVLVLSILPGSALAAGSSTCQAYSPQLCSSVGNSNTTASSAGTLPFTGLDVVLLVAGGGTLLAAGFVVRRLSRRLNN